jgi:succinate dehydrogenase/fumarate reductase cytochrome b subunit
VQVLVLLLLLLLLLHAGGAMSHFNVDWKAGAVADGNKAASLFGPCLFFIGARQGEVPMSIYVGGQGM